MGAQREEVIDFTGVFWEGLSRQRRKGKKMYTWELKIIYNTAGIVLQRTIERSFPHIRD